MFLVPVNHIKHITLTEWCFCRLTTMDQTVQF